MSEKVFEWQECTNHIAIFCDDRSEETADSCNAMGTFGNTVIDMLIMIVSPDINVKCLATFLLN